MAATDPLDRRAVEQMLVGVATPQYARSLEPLGPDMASRARVRARSAVASSPVQALGPSPPEPAPAATEGLSREASGRPVGRLEEHGRPLDQRGLSPVCALANARTDAAREVSITTTLRNALAPRYARSATVRTISSRGSSPGTEVRAVHRFTARLALRISLPARTFFAWRREASATRRRPHATSRSS